MSSSEIDYLAIFRVVDDAKKAWRDAESAVYATDQAEKIFRDILPAVLERFVRKNADYGDAAKFLGIKGQFADINPKFWKLKRALWDEEPLIGESAEEILSDLVGHCLLTLYFIETQRAEEPLPEHIPMTDWDLVCGGIGDCNCNDLFRLIGPHQPGTVIESRANKRQIPCRKTRR